MPGPAGNYHPEKSGKLSVPGPISVGPRDGSHGWSWTRHNSLVSGASPCSSLRYWLRLDCAQRRRQWRLKARRVNRTNWLRLIWRFQTTAKCWCPLPSTGRAFIVLRDCKPTEPIRTFKVPRPRDLLVKLVQRRAFTARCLRQLLLPHGTRRSKARSHTNDQGKHDVFYG